ncbi:MAG: hypothetical protein U0U46_02115 [Saprospiraceae bacterium]
MRVLFFAILAGITLFQACQSQTAQNDTKTSAVVAEETPPPPSPKPELYLYLVTTDNLLLRDQPTQKGSKSLGKFKMGDIVQGNGEVSDNKEEANIGGIPFTAPYVKVSSTSADEKTGWLFGRGIHPLYAGPRSTMPDLGRLAQLSTYLQSLDGSDFESGKKAWDYINTNFANAKGTLADGVYILFQQFMHRLELKNDYFYATLEKAKISDEDVNLIYEGKFDDNKFPVTRQLAASGFRLQVAEGSVFATADLRDFENFFAPNVTPPMKNYLHQTRVEQEKVTFDDGGIIIPLEELADRAAFWEKFNRDNPYFVLHEETAQSAQWMLAALMNGADNTPAFDYESGKPADDFKKVWEYAARQYGGYKVGKSAKQMLDLLAAEGNVQTKKVEEFRTSFHQQ